MIKAAITGVKSPIAGELIRILVNHPDVELKALHAPGMGACRAASIHHGLIGEEIPELSERFDPSDADVLFICNPPLEATAILDRIDSSELKDLRVIDLSGAAKGRHGYVCGISEIYRKQLVRGATRAFIPSPEATVALIMLHPLAANLLLPSEGLTLSIEAGADYAPSPEANLTVRETLAELQHSFTGDVKFTRIAVSDDKDAMQRGLRISATIPSAMQPADIRQLYENIYDDHNFSFTVLAPLDTREAEGTHKCLISLTSPAPDSLRVEAVADRRMRGGAGDAVHVMNLLFGLHERVGLSLKASSF